ncbi:MAG: prepilin peptidase [Carnobacterium sp.]|uniref:prepilin peptidase n=1 Tax=Carnobacterium sp. TaxID=48221 RepID=UPI003C73616A
MEQIVLLFLVWMVGTYAGSFFIVIGIAIPAGQSLMHQRSTCSSCFSRLSLIELIPFFSYIVQKGRCRHCYTRIPFLYPCTESFTGLLFVLTFFQFMYQPKEMLSLFFLIAFGIIFMISDLHYFLLPDSLMSLFFLLTLIIRLWFHPLPLLHYVISGIAFFLFFYAFYIFTSQGIGGGDVKLFGVLGLFFGFELTLFILFIACLISLLIGFPLIYLNKLPQQTFFPFAPSIFLSSFIVALCGPDTLTTLYSFLFIR